MLTITQVHGALQPDGKWEVTVRGTTPRVDAKGKAYTARLYSTATSSAFGEAHHQARANLIRDVERAG